MRKGFDLICLSEIFAVHWLSGPENGTRDSWVGSAIASSVLCSPLWRLNIWKHPENQRNLDAPQIKQRNNEFFVSPIIVRKKNLQLGKSLSRNVSNGISRWQESRCLIPAEAAAAAGEIGLKQNRMYDHFGEVCLQSKLPTLAPWLSLEKSFFPADF